jgi:hypothetical protein
VHKPSHERYDEVSETLVNRSDLVRVRTSFVKFWTGLAKLDNVFPLVWSNMPDDRTTGIVKFSFQSRPRPPGRHFSRCEMYGTVDRNGSSHRKPKPHGSLKRRGEVYAVKDLKAGLWSTPYQYSFDPAPPLYDRYPNETNTLLIDPDREIAVMTPSNVLHPSPWHGPRDRHSCLLSHLFPFIRDLASSGQDVGSHVKDHRCEVEGLDPLKVDTHVCVEMRKWLRARQCHNKMDDSRWS